MSTQAAEPDWNLHDNDRAVSRVTSPEHRVRSHRQPFRMGRPAMMQSIQHAYAQLDTFGLVFWWAVLIALVVFIVGLLTVERRMFAGRGKGGSWWFVRLCALPILAAVVAAVLLPSRATAGPEALAVFYILLFSLAPLLWFGLHGFAGWLASPRLSRGESMWLAGSGLMLLLIPPGVVSALQTPYFTLSRLMDKAVVSMAAEAPLPHAVSPVRRLSLGEAGELHAQTLEAPAGVRVERIETMSGGHWADTATQTHSWFCRDGDNLHLAWRPGNATPTLRLHWRDATQRLGLSLFQAADPAPAPPADDFTIAWRPDGFDLPVALSRDRVQLRWSGQSPGYFRSLDALQPGETFVDDCVMPGYRRVAARSEGPVAAVQLILQSDAPGLPALSVFNRPGSD